jgi:NAD(P)-dependent dehydrogenase (short-subunit alcohol dehydrogenase family)
LTTFVPFYEVAAYGASKAAVGALTKSLAIEWSKHGVNVNAIAPGVFRTSLNSALLDGTERGRELKLRTPLGRFGRVEELAGAAIFLASDAASFITGEVLAVDGGFLASGVNQ